MTRLEHLPAGALGSISTGTLRHEDVLPAMLDLLALLGGDVADLRAELDRYLKGDGLHYLEALNNMWADIEQHIDDLLPRGYRFGAHEGDGADFGVWRDNESDTPNRDFVVLISASGQRVDEGYGTHREILQSTLDYAVEEGKIAEFRITAEQDENVEQGFIKRVYKVESSGSGKYTVYEYKGEACIKSVYAGLPRGRANDIARLMNDAVSTFISDNGLDQ